MEVDHRRFKKFWSSCKNLNDKARSSRSKTVDSMVVLQAIEANIGISIQRVSGGFGTFQSNVVHHLHELRKCIKSFYIVPHTIKSFYIVPHTTKILQNLLLTLEYIKMFRSRVYINLCHQNNHFFPYQKCFWVACYIPWKR